MGDIILLVCVAGWCYIVYRGSKHAVQECKAVVVDCGAAAALANWIIANPDLHIGDIPHARQLVLNRIAAQQRLCEICLFVKKDEAFIAYLYSLLDDHGPPGPRKRLPVSRTPAEPRAFSMGSQGICGATIFVIKYGYGRNS